MKVKVITLHRIPNYGSALQAYATQEVLKKMGHDVQIIDYYTERMTRKGMIRLLRGKSERLQKSWILYVIASIMMYPTYLRRFGIFESFRKKYLQLTPREYHSAEELHKDCPPADVYLTGSDQVWNSTTNVGIDDVMFLGFAPNSIKRVAYAASFGKPELDKNEAEITSTFIHSYDAIGMREESGVRILESMGYKGGQHVLDPTLLLDRVGWEQFVSQRFLRKKFILVYNISHEKSLDHFAKRLSLEKKLPVYHITYQIHEFYKHTRPFVCPSVPDFLGLIDAAEYIITDSFHCTAFSINFHKKVLVYYPKHFSTRLDSILGLTGFLDRRISEQSTTEIADKGMDFSFSDRILDAEREKAFTFLKGAIGYENQCG